MNQHTLTRILSLAAVMGLLMAGCGDGGGGGAPIDDPQAKAAATDAAQSMASLQELKANGEDSAAVNNVLSSYSSLQGMALAKQSAQLKAAQLPLALPKADPSQCVTTSGGTTTYDHCDYGGSSINGTVGVSGDHVTVDLTWDLSSGGQSVIVIMKGDVAVTETSVSGTLAYNIKVSGSNALTYDLKSDFDVTFDGNRCATGGYIRVKQSADVAGVGNVGNFNVTVRADYGPACGDVVVR